MPRKRVAVLISGRGSNMKSLIEAAKMPDYPAEIKLVISSKADAPGLQYAQQQGIKTMVASYALQPRDVAERQIQKYLEEHRIDIVCLAGFMKLVSADFANKWHGKIINIHPSLLPKHKGLNAHEKTYVAGDRQVGCTVHFVTPEMDEGPIIVQAIRNAPEYKKENEIEDMIHLAEHVLEMEHIAYPKALAMLATEKIDIDTPFEPEIINYDIFRKQPKTR